MDDLIAFLRARLDDDEQTARAADAAIGGDADADVPLVLHEDAYEAVASHIARHDPARVLAEVNAKRRRLGVIEEAIKAGHDSYDLATVLLPLEALPYADHPDYQDAWRP